MNLRPTRSFVYVFCFIIASFLLNLSCSKDQDTFLDAVLEEEVTPIIEEDNIGVDQNEDLEEEEDEATNPLDEVSELESRITIFPTINDAYLQNGLGYDQTIVRLQENFRRSYLMFDLSEIDSIGGSITSASLEFVINQDDGNGIIKIYRGASNDWTENSLTEKSAPEIAVELGEIEQAYYVGATVNVDLDIAEVFPEFSTLILEHENGNDLAFASKENRSTVGPKLIIEYDAPVGARAIVVNDEQIIEEDTTEEDTTEEDTTEEDTTEEDTTEEDTTEEDTTEEDTTEEDTTEEDTTEEDTTEEDTTEEDTTEEDTTEEDTTEEDTTEEEDTNTPPTSIAEASPSSGELPLEVTFTGNKSSDDKAITSYEWNFKDGTTTTTTNAVHTFTQAGSYAVTLKVTDAEGLNSTDTVTITVSEKNNESPVAKASADIVSGTAPLEVRFTGSNSTDDNSVTSHTWDFKDGTSSNSENPSHTFSTPGTYAVELTVEDEQGLTDKDVVTITVNEPINQSPVAIASANITTGTAPLQVNFTGSNSTDDQAITSYEWKFKDGSTSDLANPSHTFETPGIYYVDLFVEDAQGATDFAGVTITVEEEIIVDTSCNTDGGYSHETGLKTWCWGDINVPSGASTGRDSFSDGQLALSVECSANQVVQEGDRLKFQMNPTSPSPASWCNNDFNMRSEIRTMPWQVNHPLGTEEWIGWSYTFSNDYQVDNNNPWLFFQMQQGVSGSPPIEFTVVPSSLYGAQNGEVVIINDANKTESDRTRTGVVPQGGTTLNIVVHVIHDLGSKGLLQVWINGNMVYDKQVGTVHASAPWGGNAKFGIYKWPWRQQANVEKSQQQGITNLTTYMGPLRILTRRSGDSGYGQNSYNLVVPR